MGDLVCESLQKQIICIDFRKQCRRTPNDQHCAGINLREFRLYSWATRLKLFVARNVFGISFSHTVAWGEEVAGIGGALDMMMEFQPHLMGHVLPILIHPRQFTFLGIAVGVLQPAFRSSLREAVFPKLASLTKMSLNDVENNLFNKYKNCPSPSSRTVAIVRKHPHKQQVLGCYLPVYTAS